MSKTRLFSYLRSGGGALAATLCVTLTTFGCTTDQMLGNGQPERSSPYVRSAPTAGVTSASEQPVTPPPMTSSVTVNTTGASRPATRSRGMTRLHPDEAAAIMAGLQASSRGWRVLGPSDPGFPNRPYVSRSQASASDAMVSSATHYTVNQTPFSQQVPGVAADAGTDGGTTGSVIVGGVTDLVGIAGTPTVVSGGLPPLTSMTSSSVAATTNASAAGPAPIVTGRGARSTTATAIRTGTTSAGVANPVRIVPRNSGRVLITNVTARATSNQ